MTTLPFIRPTAKLTIASLEDDSLTVEAQYNPKELQIAQSIPWHEHNPSHSKQVSSMDIEFAGVQPQTLKVDLLFDGFETNGAIDQTTVIDTVQVLRSLASVKDPLSAKACDRRPHFCVVNWGPKGSMPNLRCVIDSLTTTYQLFSATGTVLRATVSVSLKEADMVAPYKR